MQISDLFRMGKKKYSVVDNLKYSTLPLRRKKKKSQQITNDDSSVPSSKSDTPTSGKKKTSLANKARKKMSRSSKEIPVADLPKKMGLTKDVEKLQSCEKSVMAALRWFVDVVKKDIMSMLPGSTTKVLQEVMELTNHLSACHNHDESSTSMNTKHSAVYKNLAKLILWADKVVLHGRQEEGKDPQGDDGAKGITEAVKLSITILVSEYMEKLKDKEQKLKVSQHEQNPKRTSLPAQSVEPLPSADPETVHGSSETTVDYNSNSRDERSASLPNAMQPGSHIPSGHPSPERQFLSSSPPDIDDDVDDTQGPPPLPPKQGRASMFEFPTGYSETLPNKSDFLDRSFSGSAVSVMSRSSEQSHQSNFSSYSTHSSISGASFKSSTVSSVHTDSSSGYSSQATLDGSMSRMSVHSMELRSQICSSTEQFHYSVGERPRSAVETTSPNIPSVQITDPPPLPRKERQYRERKLSDYDNLDPSEAMGLKERCAQLQDTETIGWAIENGMISEDRVSVSRTVCLENTDDEPPPLPPKIKHIDTYLDVLGEYNKQQFDMEFYHEKSRQMEYRETSDEYSLQNRENFFHTSYNYTSRLPRSPRNSYGSSVETSSEGSYEGSLEGPPLPLKQQQHQQQPINFSPEHSLRGRLNTNPEMPTKTRIEHKKKSESVIENGKQCNHRPKTSPDETLLPSPDVPETGEPCLLYSLNISEHLIKNTEVGEPPIKGGPIDALIVFAADIDRKEDNNQDELVLSEVFLSTYRIVIPARELLDKLLHRYKKFRNKSDIKCKQANRNAFFLLLRIAGELIGQVEDDILEMLMKLVFQLLCDGELMLAKILRDRVLSKIENNKQAQKMIHKQPISSLEVSVSRDSLLDFRSHELAEQMTLMDSELFLKIEVPEVLLWAREQSETLSPNLTIFTEHFNKMSFWVRSLILQETKAQDREKLLIKFIKIMKHLKKMNNFNSYLAVLSALDSAPVRRLDWQKQTVEGLKEYSALIDSSSSFKAYRDALAAAEPPCIPYLGLILQDMTFVHIGNPDKLPDSDNVNFIKCWQFFNIMDSMRRFKQTQYDTLKKDDKILAFFNDFNDCLDEEAMWQLSKEIKPQTRGRANKAH
ncbi:rap guanine nucleotide exchange factor 1-like isoform X3 [Apostichopus japonicus]|uniref:rap guanine nucleotide exchange factor 1-like isoform X3 n=1 Tax=Stichopus japonicus TaxID=307972 RepID=UPI003AB6D777